MLMAEPVRLFVGGLPSDVTSEQLAQRFTPFGTVAACEVVPPKHCDVPGYSVCDQNQGCRGFAYVALLPKDNVSLSRCLSLYNHSMWRGNTLRVETARPQYLKKLQQEWEQEAAGVPHNSRKKRRRQFAADGSEIEAEEDWDGIPKPLDASQPLNLVISQTRKKTKVLKVSLGTTSKAVRNFVEIKPKALNQLAWEYDGEPLYRHVHKLNELWYMRNTFISQPSAGDCHGEGTQDKGATIAPPASLQQQTVSISAPATDDEAVLPPKSHNAQEQLTVKPAMTHPAKVSAERHSYLKVLKSVSTANQKEEAAAAAAAAAARGTSRAKQLQKQQSKRQGPQLAPLSQPGELTVPPSDVNATTSAVVNFLDDFDDDEDNNETAMDGGVRDGMSEDDLDRFASDEEGSGVEQFVDTAAISRFDEDEVDDRQQGQGVEDDDGHDDMMPSSANVNQSHDNQTGQQTGVARDTSHRQEEGDTGDEVSDEYAMTNDSGSGDNAMLDASDDGLEGDGLQAVSEDDTELQDNDIDEQQGTQPVSVDVADEDNTLKQGMDAKTLSQPALQQKKTAAGYTALKSATHPAAQTSKPQREAKPKNLDVRAVPASRPAGKGAALLNNFDSDSDESFHDVGGDEEETQQTKTVGMQQSNKQKAPATTQYAVSKAAAGKAKPQSNTDRHIKQPKASDLDQDEEQLQLTADDISPGRLLQRQTAFKVRQIQPQQPSLKSPQINATSAPTALVVSHDSHGKAQKSKQKHKDQLYVPSKSSKQLGKKDSLLADFDSDSEEVFQDAGSDDDDTAYNRHSADDQDAGHRDTMADVTITVESRQHQHEDIDRQDSDNELQKDSVPEKVQSKHTPKVQERGGKAKAMSRKQQEKKRVVQSVTPTGDAQQKVQAQQEESKLSTKPLAQVETGVATMTPMGEVTTDSAALETVSKPFETSKQHHHVDRQKTATATPKGKAITAQLLQSGGMQTPAVKSVAPSIVQQSLKPADGQRNQLAAPAATPKAFQFSFLGNGPSSPAETAAKPAARQQVHRDAALTEMKPQQAKETHHQEVATQKAVPKTAPPVHQAAKPSKQQLALPSVLQFAGSFMRTQTPEEIRSQWLAERDSLAADLKKKTRSTIKKAASTAKPRAR